MKKKTVIISLQEIMTVFGVPGIEFKYLQPYYTIYLVNVEGFYEKQRKRIRGDVPRNIKKMLFANSLILQVSAVAIAVVMELSTVFCYLRMLTKFKAFIVSVVEL